MVKKKQTCLTCGKATDCLYRQVPLAKGSRTFKRVPFNFCDVCGIVGTHAPVVHAPVVQAPVVQAPVVQAPVVQAPTKTFWNKLLNR